MKFRIAAAITGLALISVPANALTLGDGTVLAASAAGTLSVPLGGGLADFDSPLSATTYGNSSPVQGPFTVGDASFKGDGILMLNTPGGAGDSLGLYAEPFHDTTQYLTVQPGGSTETVTFGKKYSELGLYWGSMDTYNSIAFYNGNTLIETVTGSDAAASVPALNGANGDQANDATNRFITISDLLGSDAVFTSIVLTSTQNSFELDNLTWGPRGGLGVNPNATPLPGALALFVGGLGMIGLVAGRKKRKTAGNIAEIAAA